MGLSRIMIIPALAAALLAGSRMPLCAEQVWTKCHVTCRCLQNDSVGNFAFVIPIDRSPDIHFDADQACKAYGDRVCLDGCNSRKFTYTYQVTSP
ncbi:MAG: hypothetical protein V1792_07540 [Pseudomonadota bacterium]